MPDRLTYRLLCLLFVFVSAVSAAAAQRSHAAPEDADGEETTQPAEPEPPKQVMHIEVKDHLLTIEIENTDFGTVIRTIADKANFKVQGYSEVFGKKLNTKFSDIEIERGVSRLLTLVKESNYMLYYDTTGAISKLEILSAASGKPVVSGIRSPTGVQPTPRHSRARARDEEEDEQERTRSVPVMRPQMPSPLQPPNPANIQPVPVRRPIPVPVRPATPPPSPAKPQVIPDDEAEANDEEIEEIPYVPSQTTPRFTPKK